MNQTQLHQTARTLQHWLNSCHTLEQLLPFQNLIQSFIVERFQGKVEQYMLDLTLRNLKRSYLNQFKQLRQPITPALAEEAEVYPRCYDYFISPQGNLVGILKSVVA